MNAFSCGLLISHVKEEMFAVLQADLLPVQSQSQLTILCLNQLSKGDSVEREHVALKVMHKVDLIGPIFAEVSL